MRFYLPLFILVFVLLSASQAQQWKRLSQSPLGLSYEVPRNWFVGGIMDENQCNCESGTLNSSMKDQTNMVIFASNTLSLAEMKLQDLESYHFVEVEASEQIKTEFFEFEKHVSRWKEDETLQVIRLTTTRENRHYLIYFWGEPAALLAQKDNLQRIIYSIRPPLPAPAASVPTDERK